MDRVLIYGFVIGVLIIVLSLIGYIIFLGSFQIFEDPKKEIIRTECDNDGLRQVIVFTLEGNATANSSLNVSTKLGCDGYPDKVVDSLLFAADTPFMRGNELDVKWVSFDTLQIIYDARLRIFKKAGYMIFEDPKLNFVIDYQKKK